MDHGRPKFNRNSSCSGLLRFHPQTDATPSLTGLSPSAAGFPNTIQLTLRLVTARENCNPLLDDPVTPSYATLAGLHVNGLGSSPFAHHYSGYLFDFFYVRLLRCFTSPTSPPHSRVSGLRRRGCPIRTPPDLGSLAPPRGFSQLAASFFAVGCLGILRVPFSPYSPLQHCLLFFCQVTQGNLALKNSGGDDRIRTDDPWLAKPLLSH